MTTQRIIGQEVVAEPGQRLDNRELRYLLGLAEGETNEEVASVIDVRKEELPFIEASIRGKLGARSKKHMLALAFTLGVIHSRALAALFVLAAVIGTTSVVYFKKMALPHINGDGKALQYDTMAGGSNGPAVQDPNFNDYVTRLRHHAS